MQKVKNITHHILSKAWATLYRIDYDFQFKDGRKRRISRECYNRGNGTAILLYNPETSNVILTKQFRMPVYEVNPSESESIEVCAGAIDKNEAPKPTIIREVEEETGYKINDATLVLEAYMSPGAMTEKLYLFIAEYNPTMKVNEGGGIASEDEDIEVLEFPFQEAIQMVKNKTIIDAKTILLLQYAQLNNLVPCKN